MINQKFVLVRDNDPGVRNLARDILELYGHSVLTAGSWEEALTLCELRGKEISVVLLDVAGSETAAIDVFQRVLEINPAAKIIITSIYRYDADCGSFFNRGASGFLKKPYRMTELLQMIEGVQALR
jgi:DNA-binding NtrC family response regulator